MARQECDYYESNCYKKLAESTSTNVDNTVSIDGKFSDYKYIMLCSEFPKASTTTVVTGSCIYPIEMFKNMTGVRFRGISDTVPSGTTNSVMADAIYVSDTSVKLSISNNQYLKAVIYGIKG